jgi:AGCS family alanine or glycine:cation symporter
MRRRFRILPPVFPTLLFGLFAWSAASGLAEEMPQRDLRSASPTPAESERSAVGWASADPDESSEASEPEDWMGTADRFFGTYLVKPLETVLFFDFWTEDWLGTSVPLVVFWLLAGAIFFTLRMGFINVRAFWHAIRLTKGDYDTPEEAGEVSHFQALASALSATIGLGNIAGVAIAVGRGGPGAIFWMILAGLLGMSSKFAECSLSQMYRKVAPDGTVSGGPMHYLYAGLKEIRLGPIRFGPMGAVLAVLFALVCMGGSFGGGCAFQVGQSLEALRAQVSFLDQYPWIYGLVMVVLVGIVIIGGIRRIAATAEKIVPLMCIVYVAAAVYILLAHFTKIPAALALIVDNAFTPDAAYGGFLGVLVIGIKRAAFSNEAGIGSAAIAHAAAKTAEPIREGIVASLGPFIDTVIICTMTGLVIVITGAYADPEYAELISGDRGAPLTAEAFRSVLGWFPYVLTLAVVLFAYSTMISWSYYGERCWSHLFGRQSSLVYKLVFLGFVFLASIVKAKNIIDFADLMILSMAFPNILGVMLLSGRIRRALDNYWRRYKAGEMERDPSVRAQGDALRKSTLKVDADTEGDQS